MSTLPSDAPAAPSGIGGWLYLPIVHLVLNAALIAFNAATGIGEGYGWIAPAGGAAPLALVANRALLAVSWFEAGLLGFAVFCLVQLLRRKAQLPYLMIAFYALLLAMTVAEYFLADATRPPGLSPEALEEPLRAVVRTLIAAAIWIPYFIVSKRVKATFTR